MKSCKVCYEQKPLTEFYKNSGMTDGRINVCKICHNKRCVEWTKQNRDRVNANNRKRAKLPEKKLARKNECKSEKAIIARREAVQRYRLKKPYVQSAHRFVRLAIEKGLWTRAEHCSQCNLSGAIEAHHDDYTRPDVVRWLCKACHEEWHRTNKPIFVSKDIT